MSSVQRVAQDTKGLCGNGENANKDNHHPRSTISHAKMIEFFDCIIECEWILFVNKHKVRLPIQMMVLPVTARNNYDQQVREIMRKITSKSTCNIQR